MNAVLFMNSQARFAAEKVKATFAPLLRSETRDHGTPVTRPRARVTVQRGDDVTRVMVLTFACLHSTLRTARCGATAARDLTRVTTDLLTRIALLYRCRYLEATERTILRCNNKSAPVRSILG